ncbi:MAG: hypothetical protein H6604_01015 [Flavobacteriales bacterium]|nr:hypothetical protein [Flavobacteriales bacterium]
MSMEERFVARLAKKKNATFKNYGDYKLFFPPCDILTDYVKKNESLNITSWLQILENTHQKKDSMILLGDMCEVLPARNIKTFSSRKSRIKNFFKYNILRYYHDFTKTDVNSLEKWKNKKIIDLLKVYDKDKIKKLKINLPYDQIIKEITKDYDELFARIDSHNIGFEELFGELLEWYTHARIPMGQQVLTCRSKFKAVCPPMSLNILRISSSIHPKYRMNYRFFNALFHNIEELKKLNSIPTSQSPFVKRSYSSSLIFLSQGIRSNIDQFLIRRLMKNKNPQMRYRLLKSQNWVRVYQEPHVISTYKSYFSSLDNRFLSEESRAIKLLKGRVGLIKWPLINSDLMSFASTATQIDLIKKIINN